LGWLHSEPGVDHDRIAVGGASAGGGLAAAVAQLALDRGRFPVAFQLLTYPMLDDRSAVRTARPSDRDHRLWNRASNRVGWSAYLGTAPGSPGLTSPAVPSRREDLAGLAPTWIGVGSADLFHDEGVAYAARLEGARVRIKAQSSKVITFPSWVGAHFSTVTSAPFWTVIDTASDGTRDCAPTRVADLSWARRGSLRVALECRRRIRAAVCFRRLRWLIRLADHGRARDARAPLSALLGQSVRLVPGAADPSPAAPGTPGWGEHPDAVPPRPHARALRRARRVASSPRGGDSADPERYGFTDDQQLEPVAPGGSPATLTVRLC